ncbi:EAL domain-containing protein [Candidatus Gracilibacteria bacterium]|nr:EAL domain-containing protein [Candidatus Gracilibacteria bacterium]
MNGKIVEINESFSKFFGKTKKNFLGKYESEVFNKKRKEILKDDQSLIYGEKQVLQYEETIILKDKEEIFLNTKFIIFDHNKPSSICVIAKNITKRKNYEKKVQKLAFEDQLTGLINENSMVDCINKLIKENQKFHVFSIDIDRFKIINDSLGHEVGNQILQIFSARVNKHLKKYGVLGRLSGDLFFAVLDKISSEKQLNKIAISLKEVIKEPIYLDQEEIHLTSTVGIVGYNPSHINAREYIRDADTALFDAKKKGRGSISIFDQSMRNKVVRQLKMESEIIKAFKNNEFELYLQPIIPSSKEHTNYFEALIRWNHPREGLLTPKDFLDIIYDMGYITILDKWVIDKAAQIISQNLSQYKNIQLSINISAILFGYSDMKKFILNTVKKYNIQPSQLKLEITESDVLENLENALSIINDLKKKNFEFVLDDFGTGYSSLNYLKTIPVSCLKIDQCFIKGLLDNSINKDIVKAVIDLTHSLNIKVISEGVEDKKTYQILKQFNTDYIQGYLSSKPKKTEQILKKFYK